MFPSLNADASITRSRSPSGVIGGTTAGRVLTNRSASLDASWEIDLWGKLRRGVEAN
jgi:outer membrane protein TolC